ncbi:glycoside hydrolase family 15 protein [Silvibacterium dinghuense]|uniref:Glycoside hydrolase family 15 protein n=1 Tax=Silvibacterium dinghuense TaxID=1560006 RepID=A0A4Q1SDI6_9BACT|nr:glycoside hydrolase family 15 protein [Silvibacterium dinghuense]RXS95299.1 glycoside hydrolase family 15 protein [Silvibacterium dinghuense]GGH12250.1 glucoamylase [Silvibacterium dinghuense]
MPELKSEPAFQPIENYGVIGNMRSIALVSVEGSIDFLCFPDFDSPSVFAALLDAEDGGCLKVAPVMQEMRVKQMYLPDTNILLTRFLSEDGVAELTDFMPVVKDSTQPSYGHHILRMLRVVKGSVSFEMRCAPRFNYARTAHEVRREQSAICFIPQDTSCPCMALHATFPMDIEQGDAVSRFTLRAGETAMLAFGEVDEEEKAGYAELDKANVEQHFEETARYWRGWISRSNYKGRWREMVNRSALTLKLLCSQEHGSLIAAATFGLPERVGGERNWDYRYTWLRDSSFSLYAFMRLGFVEEARAFTHWLRERVHEDAEHGPLQVMYRPDGGQEIEEEILETLHGYKDSRPVRIGNAAYSQLQLDIYGELMDAVYLANKYGDSASYDGWHGLKRILEWLEQNWKRPDEGIWEVRGGAKEFLHSRLMCWVAFDRMIRLAEKRSLAGPLEKWRQTRDEIYEDIFTNFWSEKLQSFVQYKGAETVDASVLLMPLMRFISPSDSRWLSTLKAIEERLTEDALVYRYNNLSSPVDGLSGSEGSFTACSFWFVESLARSHQLEKAQLLFEKMLGYANHLGLYAEQLGSSGEHLGNFPQAFTHLALISAATYLDRALNDGHTPGAWR